MTRAIRRASAARLAAIIGVVLVVAIAATAALAAMNGSASPPPKQSLRSLVANAIASKPPEGVTADVRVSSRLMPGKGHSASGKLWWSHGRLRLQVPTPHGNAVLVAGASGLQLYNPADKTVYRLAAPAGAAVPSTTGGSMPSLFNGDVLGTLSQQWRIGRPQPTVIAGRPAYTIRLAPRDRSGKLDALVVGVDATYTVPLRFDVYADGKAAPVLSLRVTHVSFGAVDGSAFALPRAARVQTLKLPSRLPRIAEHAAHSGVRLPSRVAGLRRSVGRDGFAVYGHGLGSVLVVTHRGDDGIAHHHLVETPLGTLLSFRRGGVDYVVAGSVPVAVARAVAAGL